MTFTPGHVKVMWEAPADDDDPDAVGELGSGNYCLDHFATAMSQRQTEGFDVTYKMHDTDWGQGCETCALDNT